MSAERVRHVPTWLDDMASCMAQTNALVMLVSGGAGNDSTSEGRLFNRFIDLDNAVRCWVRGEAQLRKDASTLRRLSKRTEISTPCWIHELVPPEAQATDNLLDPLGAARSALSASRAADSPDTKVLYLAAARNFLLEAEASARNLRSQILVCELHAAQEAEFQAWAAKPAKNRGRR